ncbi:MAG: hypothetical protein GC164_03040 [Phycisphaera sp.]|nr:hypothetical protein [Phycisphaera sp.]
MAHTPKPKQTTPQHAQHAVKDFEQQAQTRQPSMLSEFWRFLAHNKKWWLTPILIVLLLFGLLVMLSSTPVGPFIYTLF